MRCEWFYRSAAPAVNSPDAGSKVILLSICALPIVQVCPRAPEAKHHNPTITKDLHFIRGCSALSYCYEEYRPPTMLPTRSLESNPTLCLGRLSQKKIRRVLWYPTQAQKQGLNGAPTICCRYRGNSR